MIQLCGLKTLDSLRFEHFKQLVRDEKVDLNCVDRFNRTPLIVLCRNNKNDNIIELIEALLSRCDINHVDNNGLNALSTLCLCNRGIKLAETAHLLIERGSNVHLSSGGSALYSLFSKYCKDSLLDVVQVLLDAGVDVNAKCQGGSSALLALCSNYDDHPDLLAVIRLLIAKGAVVNARDRRGRNALLIICTVVLDSSDLLEMVKVLVENKIDVKASDETGNTAAKLLNKRGFHKTSEIMRLICRP